MKKIILISLVSLALFGCEEKKVTEEMLLGDWQCKQTEQEAKWENGVFQDYEPPDDRDVYVYIAKYTKEKDELFIKLPSVDRKMKKDFKKLNGSYKSSIGSMKITKFNRLEYISDDEFKLISETTITNGKPENNLRGKAIQHCIRIK